MARVILLDKLIPEGSALFPAGLACVSRYCSDKKFHKVHLLGNTLFPELLSLVKMLFKGFFGKPHKLLSRISLDVFRIFKSASIDWYFELGKKQKSHEGMSGKNGSYRSYSVLWFVAGIGFFYHNSHST